MADEKKATVSFKETLNLPRTDFPIRPQAKTDDPALLERWKKEELYMKAFTLNEGSKKYILHDGPPYANGNIHLGHAYNKTIKDIITKSHRMAGKHVPVTPGWDCHGLPIELKVTQAHPELSGAELKKACRAYAQKWVDIQREEFKRLGIIMDWDRPYLTMDYSYEAAILRALAQVVGKGYLEKKNKTVPWCPSCETVLATAEIEYKERKDPSIYVRFPLTEQALAAALPDLVGKPVSLLVWTTTPWTLPLNRAVLLRPKTDYLVLEHDGQYVLVGKELADALCTRAGIEKKVVAQVDAEKFEGAYAHHPFVDGLTVPVILDTSVEVEEGTACVHSAPGCGPQDYEVGIKNNLEIFSPVSSDGRYMKGIAPTELEGMPVADGQIWVIKRLAADGTLFYKTSLRHSYPHCWRCHNGLIFRATSQWFFDLVKSNVKERALKAIESITFYPERSVSFLRATVQSRPEWCLSRQRVWGTPIAAALCTDCGTAYTSPELLEKVAQGVEKAGIEYWDTVDLAHVLPHGVTCSSCGGSSFVKEKNIVDVWFESGVSHYAILNNNPALAFPADIYAEGVDQHRAWFQSSLLTSLVLEGQAAMKSIFTHGFTVDERGAKMSKSIGNVVSPQEIIDRLGTDGLRLWVSSIDNEGDAVVSETLLKNVAEVYRKIRNTCRFLLSNLYDFDYEKDALADDKLLAIDRYALEQLAKKSDAIRAAYDVCDMTAVFHGLADYCSAELSSFYLDIIKDRLYTDQADGIKRRSAQTVCFRILDTLTRLMAPVLSFTAEYVSDHYQKNKTASIHLQPFATVQQPTPLPVSWDDLKKVRSAVLKALEGLREQGVIRHSLEARVVLYLDPTLREKLHFAAFEEELASTEQTIELFLKEFFIVSHVALVAGPDMLDATDVDGLWVKVAPADGNKCPRCWQWDTTDHEHKLCQRCQSVV